MTDGPGVGRPRGIFKRETKGARVETVPVRVERGRVVSFARLLGETDPVHVDHLAAQRAGHPDVVAPASFPTVVEMLAKEERSHRGQPDLTDMIGCDFRFLLHGEQKYTFHGLMFAGDEVLVSGEVLDFYDKRDGLLEFVVLKSIISHVDRGVLIHAERILVHRLGPPA